jgi:hypothetical protein
MNPLQKLESQGCCDTYYELCNLHPLRIGESVEKMNARSILKSAETRNIKLSKLKGPGSVYKLEDLPEGIELNFIIQSRTTVETDLRISEFETLGLGTFSTICLAAKEAANSKLPSPAYPRPEAHSIEELLDIFEALRTLAIEFDEASIRK